MSNDQGGTAPAPGPRYAAPHVAMASVMFHERAWFGLTNVVNKGPDLWSDVARAVIRAGEGDLEAHRGLADNAAAVERLAQAIGEAVGRLHKVIAVAIAPGERCAIMRIVGSHEGGRLLEQVHVPIAEEVALPDDTGPILAFDAVFAEWLEADGTAPGAAVARQVRTEARDRWRIFEAQPDLWTPENLPTVSALWLLWEPGSKGWPRFVTWVGRAVWAALRDFRARLDRRGRWKAPGQPDLFTRAAFVNRGLVWDERTRKITDRHGNPSDLQVMTTVPTESAEAARETAAVIAGLHGLSKLGWYRVRAHLLARAFDAKVGGHPRPDEVIIDGGWGGFAAEVGWRGGKAPDELRDLIRTVAGLRIVLGDASIPLLGEVHTGETHPELRERPGRPARIRLRLSDPWVPVDSMDGEDHRYGSLVIPSLSVPDVSVVNGRSQGAAARADLLAVIELRERCEEVLLEGGAELNWRHIAEVAELPRPALEPLLEAWRGRRWVETRPGLWTLADTTEELRGAHELLLEAARMIASGRKGGRKRADTKRGKRGG